MQIHEVKVHPALPWLERTDQLAWKLAAVAADDAPLDPRCVDMVINRILDVAAVSTVAINRQPVINSRTQALAHPRAVGATLFGLPGDVRVECEWATISNTAAARELDWHDNAYGADASHPCENIPALIAVAQQCGCSGADLLRAILSAYEIHLDLARALRYRPNNMDHQGLIGPAVAAGLGTLLRLDTETIFQAVNYATHVCLTTRQGRKGIPSSWKAYAPGHFAKLGVESVDRAMRGESGPAPIFEGDVSLIATVLGGPDTVYAVPLPEHGEPKRAILDTYTKEYSVSSHGQALVDLARRMKPRIDDLEDIEKIVIHFRHESHVITGCGARDYQLMYDPDADRRFLDHSAMYCFAVALEDGGWIDSITNYSAERAHRPSTVRLWRKISTVEDPEWNERFEQRQGLAKDLGARAVITFKNGRQLTDELAVADAHPRGARAFDRPRYIQKYRTLLDGWVSPRHQDDFLERVQGLAELSPAALYDLNLVVDRTELRGTTRDQRGIF